MASYDAHVTWTRDPDVGASPRYKREHEWRFDGGAVIPASPSPHIVPEPYSNPALVDPEEAFVASLSSCLVPSQYAACAAFRQPVRR